MIDFVLLAIILSIISIFLIIYICMDCMLISTPRYKRPKFRRPTQDVVFVIDDAEDSDD